MAPPLSREYITDSSDSSDSDDSHLRLKKKESTLKKKKEKEKKDKEQKSKKGRAAAKASSSESSQSSSSQSSSEDSDSSSQDDAPIERPSTSAVGKKPANTSQVEKSGEKLSKDSDLPPKSRFVLPRGFKPLKPTEISDVPGAFSNFAKDHGRKEIWHITAPPSVSIDSIKRIPWNAVNTDKPLLTDKEMSYYFKSENAQLVSRENMFLPAENEDVYYGIRRLISRSFQLRGDPNFPPGPSNEHNEGNGKRKQPKNLRMRYRPYPSKGGPPIDLGSSSESEAGGATFKFPPGSRDAMVGGKESSNEGKNDKKKEGKKESREERKSKDGKGSRKEDKKKGRIEGEKESMETSKKEKKEEGSTRKEDKKREKKEGKKRKHTDVNESPVAHEGVSQGNDATEVPRKKSKKRHTSHGDRKAESPAGNRSSSKPLDEREHTKETKPQKPRKGEDEPSEERSGGRKARKEDKKRQKSEKRGKLKA